MLSMFLKLGSVGLLPKMDAEIDPEIDVSNSLSN